MKERTIKKRILAGNFHLDSGTVTPPKIERITKDTVIMCDGRRFSRVTGERVDRLRGGGK